MYSPFGVRIETEKAKLEKKKKRKEARQKIISDAGKSIDVPKRFMNLANIKTPKRSKASISGLFNRSAFTQQTRR